MKREVRVSEITSLTNIIENSLLSHSNISLFPTFISPLGKRKLFAFVQCIALFICTRNDHESTRKQPGKQVASSM